MKAKAMAATTKSISVLTAAFGLLILSAPLFAHHGTVAFDTDKPVTMKAVVTEWIWSNPHCLLKFDVKSESGQTVHWTAETQNPATMVNAGWAKATFKPGDEITVTLTQAKNGNSVGQLMRVVLPDGKTLNPR
jgi:hypothetical protein